MQQVCAICVRVSLIPYKSSIPEKVTPIQGEEPIGNDQVQGYIVGGNIQLEPIATIYSDDEPANEESRVAVRDNFKQVSKTQESQSETSTIVATITSAFPISFTFPNFGAIFKVQENNEKDDEVIITDKYGIVNESSNLNENQCPLRKWFPTFSSEDEDKDKESEKNGTENDDGTPFVLFLFPWFFGSESDSEKTSSEPISTIEQFRLINMLLNFSRDESYLYPVEENSTQVEGEYLFKVPTFNNTSLSKEQPERTNNSQTALALIPAAGNEILEYSYKLAFSSILNDFI